MWVGKADIIDKKMAGEEDLFQRDAPPRRNADLAHGGSHRALTEYLLG